MVNSSESKVSRRDAILTSGKVAVALGAVTLLGGQLPRVRPLTAGEPEDNDMDEQEQPAGGLATVAVTYDGDDMNDVFFTDMTDTPVPHLVDLGLVPIQFVISEVSVSGGLAGGTPEFNFNTISVMTVGGNSFVHVWFEQTGIQAILPASSTRPIVVGTSVDVEALEDAVRGSPRHLTGFTINASGHKYGLLAFGSPSTAPPPDDDNDVD